MKTSQDRKALIAKMLTYGPGSSIVKVRGGFAVALPGGLREFEFEDQYGDSDAVVAKNRKDAWRLLAINLGAPLAAVKKFFKRVR